MQAIEEAADRFDRDALAGGRGGDAAHVDGQQVERCVGAAWHGDGAGVGVDRGGLGQDEAGVGHGGERGEVDMGVLVGVFAADQAGEHAGVGGFRLTRDQGEADTGLGTHGEAAQDLHMGVAGAEQDDVGFYGVGGLHGGRLAWIG